jgi:hypothetical protein
MYKVTNKLEQRVRFGKIVFESKETKELEERPYSDKFIVEEMDNEVPKTKKSKIHTE